MIVSRMMGGIGNQLFIYSFTKALSIKLNSDLSFDFITGYTKDTYGRKYELDKFNVTIKKASLFDASYFPLSKRFPLLTKLIHRKSLYLNENNFEESFINNSVKNDKKIFLEGYWQDPLYFKDYEDIIKDDLKINFKSNIKITGLEKKINESNSVAVHFRSLNFNPHVPLDYYYKSIEMLSGKTSNIKIFCFSDDIKWCKEKINIRDITFVESNQNDSFKDFYLMTLCKHFIISNSTFAWWGAWLGQNKNKIIIAPSLKLWHSKKIIPGGWIVYN